MLRGRISWLVSAALLIEVIAQEIVEDLEPALEQFRLIAGDLNGTSAGQAG
jgi:hypothetical protein